jgi:hypothetical protein
VNGEYTAADGHLYRWKQGINGWVVRNEKASVDLAVLTPADLAALRELQEGKK